MQDRNEIYNGVIERYDPDVIIFQLPGTFPWSPRRDIYLPDEVRQKIRDNNALSASTVAAVRVPYSTGSDRNEWVKQRINAVDDRLKFIKSRTDGLLGQLKDAGDPTYDALAAGVTLAVSAVPVIGGIIAGIIGNDKAAQKQAAQIESLKIQLLLKDYTADIKELGGIRTELAGEFVGGGTNLPTATNDPKANSPKAWPTWYYYVIVAVIILILIGLRNRQRR